MKKAFLIAAIALSLVSCGRHKSHNTRIEGLNAVITNAMSDSTGLEKLDRDIKVFMQRWWVKGLSLSVTRGDSLLYAKGYGWADEEKGEKMEPGTIMRVASVSKLLTATGIMKLREEGRLALSDKVFGPDGILCDTAFTKAIKDRNYYKITVGHLLRHESGLTIRRGDPMFTTRDIMNIYHLDEAPDHHTLVKLMLSRPLGFEPGKSEEYSNFGYLLLSMIIEKVGGKPYEEWMQENILKPAGCLDMHLAYNYYEQKYPNEARYYMQDNDPPVEEYNNSRDSVTRCYGGNDIRALSGAGAWVCSTPELALFVASIDGAPGVEDIISSRSVNAMTSHSDNHKFAIGWNSVKPGEGWIRTGSLSGTNAIIYHFPDGECWVLVTNTHNWKGPRFSRTLKEFVAQSRKRYSDKMPRRDLFNY